MLEAAFETALWWLGLGAIALALLVVGFFCVVIGIADGELSTVPVGLICLVFGGSLTWMLLVAAHIV